MITKQFQKTEIHIQDKSLLEQIDTHLHTQIDEHYPI